MVGRLAEVKPIVVGLQKLERWFPPLAPVCSGPSVAAQIAEGLAGVGSASGSRGPHGIEVPGNANAGRGPQLPAGYLPISVHNAECLSAESGFSL